MAAAQKPRRPDRPHRATLPDWEGYYQRDQAADHGAGNGSGGINVQVPTILSLLTPEYQKRMVQMNYHEGVANSPQWNASLLLPGGLPALLVAGQPGRQLPADHEPVAGADPVGRGRQLHAPDPDRPRARAEGAAVVRRDGRLLGRRDPGRPGPPTSSPGPSRTRCSSTAAKFADGRDLEAGQGRGRQGHRPSTRRRSSTTRTPSLQPLKATYRYAQPRPARRRPARATPTSSASSNIQNINGRPGQLTKANPRLHRLLRPALGPGVGASTSSRAGTSRTAVRRRPTCLICSSSVWAHLRPGDSRLPAAHKREDETHEEADQGLGDRGSSGRRRLLAWPPAPPWRTTRSPCSTRPRRSP